MPKLLTDAEKDERRRLARARLDMVPETACSLSVLAAELHVTRSRASQILDSAMTKFQRLAAERGIDLRGLL